MTERPEPSPSPEQRHTPSIFQHPGVFAGVLASLAVIGAAGVGGFWLSQRDNAAAPGGSSTAVANPWPLALPEAMDDFTKNPGSDSSQVSGSTPPTTTISATYSRDGATSVLLLLSRPESDAEVFLGEAAFTGIVGQDAGFCGTSADNNLDGCVVVRDGTAVLAVGMVDQSREELLDVAVAFADDLST